MARHTLAEDRVRARHADLSRAARRGERMQRRVLTAPTADAALTAAFDWFRASAGYKGRREHGRCRADAERIIRAMADTLANAAAGIDEGDDTA